MTKKQKSGAGAEGDYQLVQHEVRFLATSSEGKCEWAIEREKAIDSGGKKE